MQGLKKDVVDLNRELFVLEEELLFPANTQVALFVSMDVGKLFELESVQIKLDDKVVANYLYTPLEVAALHRGGVQRVYVGNLKAGEHSIDAFFTFIESSRSTICLQYAGTISGVNGVFPVRPCHSKSIAIA